LNKTLEQAQASLGSMQDALGDRSPLQFQMRQALTEITAAASAMRVLAEYLQQNPGVLLSGKGNP
jgi:paraquat-inducible protein B